MISHPTLIFVPGSKHPPTEETAWRPGQGRFQPSQERQRQRSLGCLAISWRFHGFYGDFMALFCLNMWLTNCSWFIHVFSLWWPHGGFMDFFDAIDDFWSWFEGELCQWGSLLVLVAFLTVLHRGSIARWFHHHQLGRRSIWLAAVGESLVI